MYIFYILVDKCQECDFNAHCVKGKCKCDVGYIGTGKKCVIGKSSHVYQPLMSVFILGDLYIARVGISKETNWIKIVFQGSGVSKGKLMIYIHVQGRT